MNPDGTYATATQLIGQSLLLLHKPLRLGSRVTSPEFSPLVGTVVHNPKGWVTVDFGDVRMIDGKIEVSKFCREEDVKNVQQEVCVLKGSHSNEVMLKEDIIQCHGISLRICPPSTASFTLKTLPMPVNERGMTGFKVALVMRRPNNFVIEGEGASWRSAVIGQECGRVGSVRSRIGSDADRQAPPAEPHAPTYTLLPPPPVVHNPSRASSRKSLPSKKMKDIDVTYTQDPTLPQPLGNFPYPGAPNPSLPPPSSPSLSPPRPKPSAKSKPRQKSSPRPSQTSTKIYSNQTTSTSQHLLTPPPHSKIPSIILALLQIYPSGLSLRQLESSILPGYNTCISLTSSSPSSDSRFYFLKSKKDSLSTRSYNCLFDFLLNLESIGSVKRKGDDWIVNESRTSVGVREEEECTSKTSYGFCVEPENGRREGRSFKGLEGTISDVLAGRSERAEEFKSPSSRSFVGVEAVNGPDWNGGKGRKWVGTNVTAMKGEVERRKRLREESDERQRKLVRRVLEGRGRIEGGVEGDEIWDIVKNS
ncbi:hypothetical protein TrVE_jg2521 [Triparma verrucosa]|uniref:Uncharacterized protein n=2 Tax=Triparma TaxID=722752 RepID=A0A9W7BCP7_9STRA|nr:hypothetical protein TrST_g10282 [Triparma strigata]GMI03840.1 hypothetical protein TrVE_jg2521 [Triparma verrucosa]